MTLPAIVLAAGASSRMGQPKALLPLGPDGEPFVSRIVSTLVGAGIARVIVVTREPLRLPIERLALPSTEIAVNASPERGQLSSLLTGLDYVGDGSAVMMTPVDVPRVSADTVRALIDTWRLTGAGVVRPSFRGRHGHPAIFGSAVIAALRAADVAAGAKPVLAAFRGVSVSVTVDDEGVVDDVDTPEAYERLTGRAAPPLHGI